jgi:hypothetical protein
MASQPPTDFTSIVGRIPYRLALAGGWIDQPTVSQHNPSPPGSMVTVQVEPEFRFMDRAGICGSTRRIAMELWRGTVPAGRDRMELVRELYRAENEGLDEPSGSQDMIGLVYPGINRLDYDFAIEGGYFPRHIESNNDSAVAAWLGSILYLVPVNQRPDGYNPLGRKNMAPEWIARLGQTGRDCYDAIVRQDLGRLGQSFNTCMSCWETIFPDTVDHPTLNVDLRELLSYYQQHYPGAMYSGCGGGYLYIVSETPVPGGFQVTVRTQNT